MTDTTNTLAHPTCRADLEEIQRGDNVIAQLLGSTIVAFGASNEGEILLVARKGDQRYEFAIGSDPEDGGNALFEVETAENPS